MERALKRRKASTAVAAAAPEPPVAAFQEASIRETIRNPPYMADASDLLRQFSHIATDSACRARMLAFSSAVTELSTTKKVEAAKKECGGSEEDQFQAAAAAAASAAASTASSMDDADNQSLLREQLTFMGVPCHAEFERLRERIVRMTPRHRIRGQTSMPVYQDAVHLLRNRGVKSDEFSADHESALLRQSGTVTLTARDGRKLTVHLPPCMFGTQCFAYRAAMHVDHTGRQQSLIRGLTEPIILMRAMTPEQLRAFLQHNELPAGEMPCVLCYRESICEYIHYTRLMTSFPSTAAAAHPALHLHSSVSPTHELCQLWHNKVDCKGGYFRHYILEPRANEVVCAPVAEATFSALFAIRETGTNTWVINQSSMVWQPLPDPVPRLAESVHSFP
jgi:hypothetical protein